MASFILGNIESICGYINIAVMLVATDKYIHVLQILQWKMQKLCGMILLSCQYPQFPCFRVFSYPASKIWKRSSLQFHLRYQNCWKLMKKTLVIQTIVTTKKWSPTSLVPSTSSMNLYSTTSHSPEGQTSKLLPFPLHPPTSSRCPLILILK